MKNNSIRRKKVTFLNKKNATDEVENVNKAKNQPEEETEEEPQMEDNETEEQESDNSEISQVNNKVEKKRKITITSKKESEGNFRRVHYWDLWKYIYNPWDADIIKRMGGEKKAENNKLLMYKRIKQIAMKRVELIDEGYVTITGSACPTNLIKLFCKERNFNDLETEIIAVVMIGDKNSVLTFKYLIELIDKLIQDEISKTQE